MDMFDATTDALGDLAETAAELRKQLVAGAAERRRELLCVALIAAFVAALVVTITKVRSRRGDSEELTENEDPSANLREAV